jgi:hypothetical protein
MLFPTATNSTQHHATSTRVPQQTKLQYSILQNNPFYLSGMVHCERSCFSLHHVCIYSDYIKAMSLPLSPSLPFETSDLDQ